MIKIIGVALIAMSLGAILGAYVFRVKMTQEGYFLPPKEKYASPSDIHGVFGERMGARIQVSGRGIGTGMMGPGDAFDALEVNGKPLEKPRRIFVRWEDHGTGYTVQKEDRKIQAGYSYNFIGYESGGFDYAPSWVQPDAQAIYGFQTVFIPTQIVEKKPPDDAGPSTKTGP